MEKAKISIERVASLQARFAHTTVAPDEHKFRQEIKCSVVIVIDGSTHSRNIHVFVTIHVIRKTKSRLTVL